MSWIYLNVIIVCTVCIKSTQCVQVCSSVHTRFRCAQSTLLSTPDAEIRSKYARYATSVHTRLKKCALGVHRCAQYSQSWSGIFSRRISPTIEHTMCVLDTLCKNFVYTFLFVCTLCVNSCVPARTVCTLSVFFGLVCSTTYCERTDFTCDYLCTLVHTVCTVRTLCTL